MIPVTVPMLHMLVGLHAWACPDNCTYHGR